MNTEARRRWIALGLALVAVIAWLGWRGQVPPAVYAPVPAAVPNPETPAAAMSAPVESTPRPIDPSSARRELPAAGVIDELAARAGAGDAIAACQLGAALSTCRVNETLRSSGSRDPEHASTPRCEALLAKYRDRHFEYLRQAAHAGEPEAMLRYASGEAFGVHGDSFAYLRSPRFDTWRREAPAMLQALVEAGHPEAAGVRMLASDPTLGGPLHAALAPDRLQDTAYAALVMRLHEGGGGLLATLAARNRGTEHEEAIELATRWHQDHFGGRTYDFEGRMEEGGFPLMRASGAHCSVAVDGQAP